MITKSGEVICTATFYNESCVFEKGKTYKAIYDPDFNPTFNTRIYQDDNNFISFHITSIFNKDHVTRHFRTLSEIRKQKLIKIKNV